MKGFFGVIFLPLIVNALSSEPTENRVWQDCSGCRCSFDDQKIPSYWIHCDSVDFAIFVSLLENSRPFVKNYAILSNVTNIRVDEIPYNWKISLTELYILTSSLQKLDIDERFQNLERLQTLNSTISEIGVMMTKKLQKVIISNSKPSILNCFTHNDQTGGNNVVFIHDSKVKQMIIIQIEVNGILRASMKPCESNGDRPSENLLQITGSMKSGESEFTKILTARYDGNSIQIQEARCFVDEKSKMVELYLKKRKNEKMNLESGEPDASLGQWLNLDCLEVSEKEKLRKILSAKLFSKIFGNNSISTENCYQRSKSSDSKIEYVYILPTLAAIIVILAIVAFILEKVYSRSQIRANPSDAEIGLIPQVNE